MGLRKFKPVTPGQRFKLISDFTEITSTTPEKSLLLSKKLTMTAVSLTLRRSRDMPVRQRKPRCSMIG